VIPGTRPIPTVAEAIDQALTSAERDAFIARLRPLVEQGLGEWADGDGVSHGD
jgi:hypothetical protein